MKKLGFMFLTLCSFCFLAAAFLQVNAAETLVSDVLTNTFLGVSDNKYTAFSDVQGTSGVTYAGQIAADTGDKVQLRSTKDNENNYSGIVTTGTSNAYVRRITVVWNSKTSQTAARTLSIYGKTSAYTGANDLYSNDAGVKGTSLGNLKYDVAKGDIDTELSVTGDYSYIGIRSNSGALYLTSITIEWGVQNMSSSSVTVHFDTNGGSVIADKKVEPGEKLTNVATPTKSGYVFAGWYRDNNTFEQEWNLENDMVSEEMTLYAKWDERPASSIAEAKEKANNEEVVLNNVTVVATYGNGFLVKDSTGTLLIYKGYDYAKDLSIGDQVKVTGKKSEYSKMAQIADPVYTKTGTETVTQPTPNKLTAEDINDTISQSEFADTEYVTMVGTLTISGSYFNVLLTGPIETSVEGSISYYVGDLSALNGKKIAVTGYFIGVSGSSTKYYNIMATEVREASATEVFETIYPEMSLKIDFVEDQASVGLRMSMILPSEAYLANASYGLIFYDASDTETLLVQMSGNPTADEIDNVLVANHRAIRLAGTELARVDYPHATQTSATGEYWQYGVVLNSIPSTQYNKDIMVVGFMIVNGTVTTSQGTSFNVKSVAQSYLNQQDAFTDMYSARIVQAVTALTE